MDVHSWYVGLDVLPAAYARLHATLTGDERSRGARFRFEQDRRRFIVARGALRDLLGRYLGMPPGDIRFVYNAAGKPALDPAFGSELTFNLSHSGGCALIAMATGADVGVDVECVRALPDHMDVARSFFAAADVERLGRLPQRLQAHGFFRCWTKREAYVKARGSDLGMSADTAPEREWSLFTLHPAPGYVGALAVAGNGWRLRQWDWEAPLRHRAAPAPT